MYPPAKQVALVMAVMIKRAEKTRARVSERTVKTLAGRNTLRDAFVFELRQSLEDFGVLLVRLDRGGFALVAISALEGAPTVLAKELVSAERKGLQAGTLDEQALLRELGLSGDYEQD